MSQSIPGKEAAQKLVHPPPHRFYLYLVIRPITKVFSIFLAQQMAVRGKPKCHFV